MEELAVFGVIMVVAIGMLGLVVCVFAALGMAGLESDREIVSHKPRL